MVLLDHGGRPRHESRIIAPPDDLGGLVEHLWVHHRLPPIRDWRIVPDASPHLIASITESAAGRHLRVGLVGPRSRVASIDVAHRLLTIGIRLRPGALTALVRASATELADTSVPIDVLFSRRILSDLELSADAPVALLCGEMVRLLRRAEADRALARSCGERDRGDRGVSAVGEIARIVFAQSRVRAATAALGVSERTLRDRVRQEIGLSPKRTLRILRLHRALLLARTGRLSWADVASISGYADQAHFTRECRVLLGETPTQWRARGAADSFKTADAVEV
jgi:AraC-like DNA-binding protein